ncbi:hypothetical protein DFQ01_11087 [Paenibacillus cellulosilyticus]|uniref:Uncharacterized protein n=1 Tax=Paenibacillus cellulosilyticus TaxID=375489 RepID=A0A2V2YSM1_9BACL|nr:hypothetical protein [Paenibacillus cellulosilyticus]PWW01197.1 hypothetical protein DFQ01_11087 [Paenibacillus cellulosilyticus]QKS46848.1 hypothetical protein HUB94_20405 [Paenibacillus cellulosilyticus]
MKNQLKLLTGTFVVGVLLGMGTIAMAGTATSNTGYYGPINGYSYSNFAKVSTDTYLYGQTRVDNQASGSIPSGYMGAKARLYKSDVLCYETDLYYSNSASSGIGVSTQSYSTGCGSGTYSSKGISAAYNGNGYDLYNTFVTPYQSQP